MPFGEDQLLWGQLSLCIGTGSRPFTATNTGPSPVVNRPPYLTAGVRVCLQVRVEHYVNHENLSVCVCVLGALVSSLKSVRKII